VRVCALYPAGARWAWLSGAPAPGALPGEDVSAPVPAGCGDGYAWGYWEGGSAPVPAGVPGAPPGRFVAGLP